MNVEYLFLKNKIYGDEDRPNEVSYIRNDWENPRYDKLSKSKSVWDYWDCEGTDFGYEKAFRQMGTTMDWQLESVNNCWNMDSSQYTSDQRTLQTVGFPRQKEENKHIFFLLSRSGNYYTALVTLNWIFVFQPPRRYTKSLVNWSSLVL